MVLALYIDSLISLTLLGSDTIVAPDEFND